ncbi:hypothetical protein [Desulfovermiculus halophilus]|jgi:hypothetical protein|uniref:hypothetical protein n=1 Tax=Desulfovermiculus halophilus TaxID=339722 RepID=UPI0004898D86|nr:hypothetical protein [Desulfovermiculus halophilus]
MGTKQEWTFRSRFRKHAFGWRSQTPIKRIKEAVSEIKKVSRQDTIVAAEGAVILLEKLPPALELVDGSSGALVNNVNKAIDELVPIIAQAPAEDKQREKWLQRLWKAIQEDSRPDIEYLEEHWGRLCGSPERASAAADSLIGQVRSNWIDESGSGRHFKGIIPCLSSLYEAGRHEELLKLLDQAPFPFWPYRVWGTRALEALGRPREAVAYAEETGRNEPFCLDQECEAILLRNGMDEEAYANYAFKANQRTTYQAMFKAIIKKYPSKDPREILADLVQQTPGREGKWFAAAKSCGLYDEAVRLAQTSPCDPKTLIRAARDMEESRPEFAMQAGFAALYWLVEGYGYEITNFDVLAAYEHTLNAAEHAGTKEDALEKIRDIVRSEATKDQFVSKTLGRKLGLR